MPGGGVLVALVKQPRCSPQRLDAQGLEGQEQVAFDGVESLRPRMRQHADGAIHVVRQSVDALARGCNRRVDLADRLFVIFHDHLATFVFASDNRMASAISFGTPNPQKWRKKSRGDSRSMCECTAVTRRPWASRSWMTGFTSLAIRTKSPLVATLSPSRWKLT